MPASVSSNQPCPRGYRRSTCRISSYLIQPLMSILLEKTRRLAPIRRCSANQQRSSIQSTTQFLPPQAVAKQALSCSHRCVGGLLRPQPRSRCPFSRSNSSSRIAVWFDHPHPLESAPVSRCGLRKSGKNERTDVETIATSAVSKATSAGNITYPLCSMVLMMKPRVGLVS